MTYLSSGIGIMVNRKQEKMSNTIGLVCVNSRITVVVVWS